MTARKEAVCSPRAFRRFLHSSAMRAECGHQPCS